MAIKLVFASLLNPNGSLAFGKDNALPWGHEPVDLKFFKEQTQGTVLVMGANTWHSLPGKLPGRIHVVLTSDPSKIKGNPDHIYSSLYEAVASFIDNDISVIGGANLLVEALPYANSIAMGTFIATEDIEADVHLPLSFMDKVNNDFKVTSSISSTEINNPSILCWSGKTMERI